jgi:hypothetical protein
MLNIKLYHFAICKMEMPNKSQKFFCVSINDPSMNFESEESIKEFAEKINEIYSGRKEQNRGSELLFLFSFEDGILYGSGDKNRIKGFTEEEQCIFFQNLTI